MSLFLKNVIEPTALPRTLAEGEIAAVLALTRRNRPAVQVYTVLRKEAGPFTVAGLCRLARVSAPTWYSACKLLKSAGLLSERIEGGERILRAGPVQSGVRVLRTRFIDGYTVFTLDGPDGSTAPAQVTEEELQRIAHRCEMSEARTQAAMDIYGYLRSIPDGQLVAAASIAASARVHPPAAAAALNWLEEKHLIVVSRRDEGVRGIGVPPMLEEDVFDDEEITIWLKAAEKEVEYRLQASADKREDAKRLFRVYRQLATARWGGTGGEGFLKNQRMLEKLLMDLTYRQAAEMLCYFMSSPSQFEAEIGDKIKRYGLTIRTFAYNISIISEVCNDVSRRYRGRKDWYLSPLRQIGITEDPVDFDDAAQAAA